MLGWHPQAAAEEEEKDEEAIIKVNNVPAQLAMKVFSVVRGACTSARVASQIGRKGGGDDLSYHAVCKKTGGELASVLEEKLSRLSEQVTLEVTTAVTQLVVLEFKKESSK